MTIRSLPDSPPPAPNRRRGGLRLGGVILAVLTIPVTILTLLGLEPLALLPGDMGAGVSTISQLLIQIVSIVGAVAVVIGVLNLIGVQMSALRNGAGGSNPLYGLITVLTLVGVVMLHVLERAGVLGINGSAAPALSLRVMDALQVVVESALAGLLLFFLVFAAYRMLRHRANVWGLLFVAALLIVLVGYSPLSGLEFLASLRDWLLAVPVNAGTRGLLIGVAIGVVAVGVRVLIGQDRTFRE